MKFIEAAKKKTIEIKKAARITKGNTKEISDIISRIENSIENNRIVKPRGVSPPSIRGLRGAVNRGRALSRVRISGSAGKCRHPVEEDRIW